MTGPRGRRETLTHTRVNWPQPLLMPRKRDAWLSGLWLMPELCPHAAATGTSPVSEPSLASVQPGSGRVLPLPRWSTWPSPSSSIPLEHCGPAFRPPLAPAPARCRVGQSADRGARARGRDRDSSAEAQAGEQLGVGGGELASAHTARERAPRPFASSPAMPAPGASPRPRVAPRAGSAQAGPRLPGVPSTDFATRAPRTCGRRPRDRSSTIAALVPLPAARAVAAPARGRATAIATTPPRVTPPSTAVPAGAPLTARRGSRCPCRWRTLASSTLASPLAGTATWTLGAFLAAARGATARDPSAAMAMAGTSRRRFVDMPVTVRSGAERILDVPPIGGDKTARENRGDIPLRCSGCESTRSSLSLCGHRGAHHDRRAGDDGLLLSRVHEIEGEQGGTLTVVSLEGSPDLDPARINDVYGTMIARAVQRMPYSFRPDRRRASSPISRRALPRSRTTAGGSRSPSVPASISRRQ